jgi:hypothetical protein
MDRLPNDGYGVKFWRPWRDPWVEKRLAYLDGENDRLNGSVIASHYLRCAWICYHDFRASGAGWYRRHAWRAIVTASAWLAQLEEGRGKQ